MEPLRRRCAPKREYCPWHVRNAHSVAPTFLQTLAFANESVMSLQPDVRRCVIFPCRVHARSDLPTAVSGAGKSFAGRLARPKHSWLPSSRRGRYDPQRRRSAPEQLAPVVLELRHPTTRRMRPQSLKRSLSLNPSAKWRSSPTAEVCSRSHGMHLRMLLRGGTTPARACCPSRGADLSAGDKG
jgi:hypothetical protein